MQKGGKAPVADVWKPAPTPRGGTSWSLLESTKEITRTNADGFLLSKPVFPAGVKALAGKRITVSGYMQPLETSGRQKHFVLLAYPPGCPFHFHAMPDQFIEVVAATPFPLDERRPTIVTGTLQLTGQDESGIFYKLVQAVPA
uniref:DUF3299 domain-containing protein n=1 Tax=Sphingomonas sp. PL-96 TaxID=2887201 RepID=UPI001E5A3DE2|nr:DUF3299 domain-containing protein [Sphingomonas sp. PL-96]